jgi:putative transposase
MEYTEVLFDLQRPALYYSGLGLGFMTYLKFYLLIKYVPKYSESYIIKTIKGRISRVSGKRVPHLKKWCGNHLWSLSSYHGSVGAGWDVVEKYIPAHNTYEYNRR